MVDNTAESDFSKAFESYCRLQSESYEFITRSIAMRNWLEEAFRIYRERPDLTAEELYRSWQPSFERIYGHLFAPLLRSYQAMMFPFGQLPGWKQGACDAASRR